MTDYRLDSYDHALVDAAADSPVLAELAQHVLNAAAQGSFSEEKTLCLLDIFWELHRYCLSLRVEELTSQLLVSRLEELVAQHSVHRPPVSLQILDIMDVQLVVQVACERYIRFAALYRYTCAPRRALRVEPALPPIECSGALPPLRPLREAVMDEVEPKVDREPKPAPPAPVRADEPAESPAATEGPAEPPAEFSVAMEDIQAAVSAAAEAEMRNIQVFFERRVQEAARQIVAKGR